MNNWVSLKRMSHRDMRPPRRGVGVYVIFCLDLDDNLDICYVGSCRDLQNRLSIHWQTLKEIEKVDGYEFWVKWKEWESGDRSIRTERRLQRFCKRKHVALWPLSSREFIQKYRLSLQDSEGIESLY